MKLPQNCVLIVGQHSEDLHKLETLLLQLSCMVVRVNSMEQVMVRASQTQPYLVILAGYSQTWSRNLVNQLRNLDQTGQTMIVALSDRHAPSWFRQEENPGIDGFLVKPLGDDVLMTLVQSARARQSCFSLI